jgi:hypothetical protein
VDKRKKNLEGKVAYFKIKSQNLPAGWRNTSGFMARGCKFVLEPSEHKTEIQAIL